MGIDGGVHACGGLMTNGLRVRLVIGFETTGEASRARRARQKTTANRKCIHLYTLRSPLSVARK